MVLRSGGQVNCPPIFFNIGDVSEGLEKLLSWPVRTFIIGQRVDMIIPLLWVWFTQLYYQVECQRMPWLRVVDI